MWASGLSGCRTEFHTPILQSSQILHASSNCMLFFYKHLKNIRMKKLKMNYNMINVSFLSFLLSNHCFNLSEFYISACLCPSLSVLTASSVLSHQSWTGSESKEEPLKAVRGSVVKWGYKKLSCQSCTRWLPARWASNTSTRDDSMIAVCELNTLTFIPLACGFYPKRTNPVQAESSLRTRWTF